MRIRLWYLESALMQHSMCTVYIASALGDVKLMVEGAAISLAYFRKHICCSSKVITEPDGATSTKMTRIK